MTLQLTLESLDGLPADVAAEYIEEDGVYRLDVAGLPDTGALKRAKDHEKNKRKQAETRITQLESELEEAIEQAASGGKGLDDKTRQRLEKKISELQAELDNRNNGLVGEINRLTAHSAASKLASDLTDSPSLLLPVIQGRLKTEMVDGRATLRVLDEDGDESGMTLQDLEKEIRGNKEYAAIIRSGKGSGSGTPPGVKDGGSAPGKKTKLSDYNHKERIELREKDPELFDRLVAESRKGR